MRRLLEVQDPGWRPGWARAVPLMVTLMLRRSPRRAEVALTRLRGIFLAFCCSDVLIGLVLLAFDDRTKPGWFSAEVGLGIVCAVGVASVCWVLYLNERSIDGATAEELRSSYERRFFRQMAFTQGVAVVAFVLAFQSGPLWLYGPGALLALLGMSIAAPTTRRIARDQSLYAAMLEVT